MFIVCHLDYIFQTECKHISVLLSRKSWMLGLYCQQFITYNSPGITTFRFYRSDGNVIKNYNITTAQI